MSSKRILHRKLFSKEPSANKRLKLSDLAQLKIDGESSDSQKKQKRKHLKIAKKHRKAKKKRKLKDAVDEDTRTPPIDYISGLPEHIIHHILSFFRCPKDAARLATLSTKWRMIWKSFLTFDFDQKKFNSKRKADRIEFQEFVDSSLTRRLVPLECVQKFRLSIVSFSVKMAPRVNSWLAAAISKNVRELELHLESKNLKKYYLPQGVLASESLTTLKLFGCQLGSCSNMRLCKLRQFSFKKMRIDKNIVESFISSCPLVEDMRLIHCTGLDTLHVTTLLKLNRVEIHECYGLRQVEISIPNLQTFWFVGMRYKPCIVDLNGCHNLRSLTLKDTEMNDTIFHQQITQFLALETLVLKDCSTLDRITILSAKLQRLVLTRCKKLLEAIVDAPNLQFFEFIGNKLPLFNINAPKLCDAKIYFESVIEDKINVREFFGKMTVLKGLKLIMRHVKNPSWHLKDVVIYEELVDDFPDIKICPINYLKLDLKGSFLSLVEHVDSLLGAIRPRSLTVVLSSSNKLKKFLDEKILNRETGSLNCCTYYSKKCWRHYLKDVTVTEKEGGDPENPLLPSSKILKTVSYSLDWEPVEDK